MSLTDNDKQLIAESFELFAAQTAFKKAPLSRIIPWLGLGRACALVPLANEQLVAHINSRVHAATFSESEAAECFNMLRNNFLPNIRDLRIVVKRCAPLSKDDGVVCKEQASQPGCDACAGRQYFAKTDGNTVWMADTLFEQKYCQAGSLGGVNISSFTEFVIFHEFSHMMQANGDAYFAKLIALYNEAKTLIPPELLQENRVLLPDNDMLEFASNAFAFEHTRADRVGRSTCEQ